jgi:hypothetical protein
MISVFRAPDKHGRDAIALLLSQDAMVVLEDGEPYPGVALYAPQAREIAHRLLLFAQEIENGRPASLPHSGAYKEHPSSNEPCPGK